MAFIDKNKIQGMKGPGSGKIVLGGSLGKIVSRMKSAVGGPSGANTTDDVGGFTFVVFRYEGYIQGNPGRYAAKTLTWLCDPTAEDELKQAEVGYVDSSTAGTSDASASDPSFNQVIEVWAFPDIDSKSYLSQKSGNGFGICIGEREDGTPVVLSLETNVRVGKIVKNGPGGEGDFSDNRYWVKLQEFSSSSSIAPGNGDLAITIPPTYPSGSSGDASLGNIVLATNLCESTSHFLRPDTLVALERCTGEDGKSTFVFTCTPNPGCRGVRVYKTGGAAGSDNTYASFVYDIYSIDSAHGTDAPLATSVGVQSRLIPVKMKAASDGSYAVAVGSGSTWVLVTIGEQVDTVVSCSGDDTLSGDGA